MFLTSSLCVRIRNSNKSDCQRSAMTSTLKKFRVTFTTDIFLSTTRGLNLFTIRQRRNALLYTRRNQYHHCKGKKTIITTPVIATTWARKLSIIDSHHQQPLVFKSSLDSSLPRFLKNPFVGETLTVPSIQRTSQNLKKKYTSPRYQNQITQEWEGGDALF